MHILIAAVGRMKAGAERDLCDRYLDRSRRAGRHLGFSGPDIIEIDEGRQRDTIQRKSDEAARLLKQIPTGCKLVALDEGGKDWTSRQLTQQMERWRDEAVPAATFVIGGADGHGPQVLERADVKLSFGGLTWPHMLVRIMLAEQIYRACTLLSGHPYHRD